MSGFKLLAIRPLFGCDPKYRKNLKEGILYKFYHNYIFYVDEEGKEIELTPFNFDLFKQKLISRIASPKEEVDIYSHGKVKISVSAVVGKNGSGKSTLLEMLFMAKYLIAVKANILDKKKNLNNIADEFRAEFFYQLGSDIYCLRIDKGVLTQIPISGSVQTKRNYRLNQLLQDKNFDFGNFFYSIAINYSLYSLNSKVLGSWIDSLFHKNDGYQTPIVINPYRDNGDININTELYLSKQRLISNLLKPYSGTEDHLKLTDFQKVSRILFSINTDKTIYAYKRKVGEEEIEIQFDELFYGLDVTRDSFVKRVVEKFLGKNTEFEVMKTVKHFDDIEKYIIKKLIQISRTYPKYKDYFEEHSTILLGGRIGDTITEGVEYPANRFIRIDSYLDLLFGDRSHITFKLRQAINYLIVDPFKLEEPKEVKIPYATINAFHISPTNLSEKIKQFAKTQQDIILYIPPALFDLEIEFEPLSSRENQFSYYSTLSSGEQQLIQSVQSILYHINNLDSVFEDKSNSDKNKKKYSHLNIILDEIELYFHPEFQQKFIAHLIKALKNLVTTHICDFNILFSTHSPFILSDIPAQNVLRLDDGTPRQYDVTEKTFGANIYDLLSNDFFLTDGFMGDFAKTKIEQVISKLNFLRISKEYRESADETERELLERKLFQIMENHAFNKPPKERYIIRSLYEAEIDKYELEQCILLIGEPVLKNKLLDMYENCVSESKLKKDAARTRIKNLIQQAGLSDEFTLPE